MAASARSLELRAIAQSIADALPETVLEVVLTGSVSRGVADDVSDIEMLIVTPDQLELEECFALATACGLADLGTWGQQGVPTKRVSGYRDGAPIELIWWSRAHAETAIDDVFTGGSSATADAIAHGVALRTSGLLALWQARLRRYPDDLASAQIEEAALTWGGFAAAGLLTILRPGERLALLERMVDDASRVVRIVFALNRVWKPTHKRLSARAATLAHKPERLVERIEEALTEPDAHRALLVLTELQADTVALAPDGPNIVRARKWLSDAREILGQNRPVAEAASTITFLTQDDLPTSNFSRELVGEQFGGIPACVIFVDAGPGDGPALHTHPYAELFFVLEGEATFSDGTSERTVGAGAVVIVPPEHPHSFVNSGSDRLRQIDVHLSPRFRTNWLS